MKFYWSGIYYSVTVEIDIICDVNDLRFKSQIQITTPNAYTMLRFFNFSRA